MHIILSTIHIFAGFVCLILFWLPVMLKKGSTWHKRFGIAFSISIIFVITSAVWFSVAHLLIKEYAVGLGFSFLSLLTTKVLTEGFTAARFKNKPSGAKMFINIIDICIALLSIAMLVTGSVFSSGFLFMLGAIGLLLFIQWSVKNKTKIKNADWKQLHYRGMIFSGVAAYTAFLIIGFNSFFGSTSFEMGGFSIMRWVLPSIFGIIGVKYLNKIYKSKTK